MNIVVVNIVYTLPIEKYTVDTFARLLLLLDITIKPKKRSQESRSREPMMSTATTQCNPDSTLFYLEFGSPA